MAGNGWPALSHQRISSTRPPDKAWNRRSTQSKHSKALPTVRKQTATNRNCSAYMPYGNVCIRLCEIEKGVKGIPPPNSPVWTGSAWLRSRPHMPPALSFGLATERITIPFTHDAHSDRTVGSNATTHIVVRLTSLLATTMNRCGVSRAVHDITAFREGGGRSPALPRRMRSFSLTREERCSGTYRRGYR